MEQPNKQKNICVSVAADFTTNPGADLIEHSDYSGQEFYEKILKPKFEEAIAKETQLDVNLDFTNGYTASFINQCFGSLVEEFGIEQVYRTVSIISNEEPQWINYIYGTVFKNAQKRYDDKNNRQKTAIKLLELYKKIYRLVIDFQERFQLLENKFDVSLVGDTLYGMSITDECIDDMISFGRISMDESKKEIRITFTYNNKEIVLPYEVLDYNDTEIDELVKNEFNTHLNGKIERKKREQEECDDILEKLNLAKENLAIQESSTQKSSAQINNPNKQNQNKAALRQLESTFLDIMEKYDIEEKWNDYIDELSKSILDK